jgi:exopolyphosphatase/guanosine-5'-triphosphate,3'-diphosphate pyrophosphatase
MTGNGKRQRERPRAIVDIGSNTIRMVVYGNPPRAPHILHNEKSVARLGRDLSRTGKIPDKAAKLALDVLRRFARLIDELQIEDVEAVATAAVRDAKNGAAFLDEVRALGFEPRLLSGKQEAQASADGVLGAFPGARGVVADLGGGSLELRAIDDEGSDNGTTLPLGTLRLPSLPAKKGKRAAIAKVVSKSGFGAKKGQTLYLVGGTLRAFGRLAMIEMKSPLEDPHGFVLEIEDARRIAKRLTRRDTDKIAGIDEISSSRRDMINDASALVGALLSEFEPDRVVFSAWGLREGLLMQRLPRELRVQDPLLSGVTDYAARRGVTAHTGAMVAGWIAGLPGARANGTERLRLVTAMLALASQRLEPNIRRRHAYDWALHKRWIGLAPADRAKLAAALLAQTGRTKLPKELAQLATKDDLAEGIAWGLAIRLLRRLGSASLSSLVGSMLRLGGGRLVLVMAPEAMSLCGPGTDDDLAALADHLRLEPAIEQRTA